MELRFNYKEDKHTIYMIFLSLAVFYVLVAWDFVFHRPDFNIFTTILGTIIFFTGFLLRVIAHNNLQEQFHIAVRIIDNHKLITDNIHSYIRHPMYTGMFLLLLGITTIFSSSYGIAVLILLVTPIGIYRTIVEERALKEHFGNDYINYCFVTKRFLPYLF